MQCFVSILLAVMQGDNIVFWNKWKSCKSYEATDKYSNRIWIFV